MFVSKFLRPRTFLVGFGFLSISLTILVANQISAAEETAAESSTEEVEGPSWPNNRWKVLFPTRAADTSLVPLKDYSIHGPYEDSPLFLSRFAADTSWDVRDRMLQVPGGNNAVLKLGRAQDFILEGTADLSGPGGMFFVFGEDDEHGYGLSSTTMLKSGCPWQLFEFRAHAAIDGTMQELAKYEPLRADTFRLAVIDSKLSFQIGRIDVFESIPLENYHLGDVLIGVYDTRYGPRKVKIQNLRARGVESEEANSESADEIQKNR